MTTSSKNRLVRYTDLLSLVHLLDTKTLTLVDPQNWYDKNDAYNMALYKKKRSLGHLSALCFTLAGETAHFWHGFASGLSGVRITFDKRALLADVKKFSESSDGGRIRRKKVCYKRIKSLDRGILHSDDLPFVKRWPYRDEREYRIIYEAPAVDKKGPTVAIPIGLNCIQEITLSPALDKDRAESLISTLTRLPGYTRKIKRTTLLENYRWKRFGDDAT